jgi:hypothetical protein
MNQFWTQQQKKIIKDFSKNHSDLQLAEFLTQMTGKIISKDAARKLRQRLGVKKIGTGHTFRLDDQ